MEKHFKIPITKIIDGTAYVKADSLEDAISIIQDECANGRFTQECSWDDDLTLGGYYKINASDEYEGILFEEMEEYQDNIDDLYDNDNTSLDIIKEIKKERYCLSEEEFNIVNNALQFTKIDMAIDQFYLNGEKVDTVYDFEEDCYYSLKKGIQLILDGCDDFKDKKKLENLIKKL